MNNSIDNDSSKLIHIQPTYAVIYYKYKNSINLIIFLLFIQSALFSVFIYIINNTLSKYNVLDFEDLSNFNVSKFNEIYEIIQDIKHRNLINCLYDMCIDNNKQSLHRY